VTPAMRRGRRLTIYFGEYDRAKGTHHPLAAEIVQRAVDAGLAGASAFRGWEGFGSSNHIHTMRLLSLAEDLPLVIVIVDTPERIAAFLPQLDDLIAEGTAVLDDVDLLHFGAAEPDGSAEAAEAGTDPQVDAAPGGDPS
jgi:PII-like signaling protein